MCGEENTLRNSNTPVGIVIYNDAFVHFKIFIEH